MNLKIIYSCLLILFVFSYAAIAQKTNNMSNELDSVCDNIGNSYSCAQAIEHYQFHKPENSKFVSRVGQQLKLNLIDGKPFIVKDSSKITEASGESFSFREYLRDVGYFLIHVQYYENTAYLMINDKTGEKFKIAEPPIFSPDKQRFVSVIGSLVDEVGIFQIWHIIGNRIISEFEIAKDEAGNGLIENAEWINNQKIKLTKNVGTEEQKRNIPIIIVLCGSKWYLETSNLSSRSQLCLPISI